MAKKRAEKRLTVLVRVEHLMKTVSDLVAKVKNLEDARGLSGVGSILVGRYGSTPIGFAATSTVRYFLKGDAIDGRLEEGSHVWFQCAEKGRRLEVNLGNGVWFPVGGVISLRLKDERA
jgi:hypothetical protein